MYYESCTRRGWCQQGPLYEADRATARRSTAGGMDTARPPGAAKHRHADDGESMSQTAEEPKKPVEIEDGNLGGVHDPESRNTELSPDVLVPAVAYQPVLSASA